MHNETSVMKHKIHHSTRRRANIMLFVIFILGSLFATSMGFLAVMRVDRLSLSGELQERNLSAVLDTVIDDALVARRDTLFGRDGIPYSMDWPNPTGQDVWTSTTGPSFEMPLNPDVMDHFAEIPGVHPWVASATPYSSGYFADRASNLEYFGETQFARAADGMPDVARDTSGLNGIVYPLQPGGRPVRLRAKDPALSTDTYIWDRTDDTQLFHGSLTDGDGDGLVDSRAVSLTGLGGGEFDFIPRFAGEEGQGISTDGDVGCASSVPTGTSEFWAGPPAVTTGRVDVFTPLPCDHGGNNEIDDGTAYPSFMRRRIVSQLLQDRDDVPDDQSDEDLFVSLRMIQNGGMVNLNDSHLNLVDNVLGLGPQGDPVAFSMQNMPYGTSTEQWLRRRHLLPPRDLDTTIGLGRDMITDRDSTDPRGLYSMIVGALATPSGTGVQWYPITDEPGVVYGPQPNRFDTDVAGRWFDPFSWNDPADSAGLGTGVNYDIRRLLTVVSTDDLLRRGAAQRSAPDGHLNGYDGNDDGEYADIWAGDFPRALQPFDVSTILDLNGNPYFADGQPTALDLYPGYDPVALANFGQVTGPPPMPVGDLSFIEVTTDSNGMVTPRPKVPLRLAADDSSGSVVFGVPADGSGTRDLRFGNMQFWLHSIGNIDNTTLREQETVRAYFLALLANVDSACDIDPDPAGCRGRYTTSIGAQALQLTANLIDFADTVDTPVVVPAGAPKFAGIENYPFISEVYLGSSGDPADDADPGNIDDPKVGIKLFFPHGKGAARVTDYYVRVLDNNHANPTSEIRITDGDPAGQMSPTQRFVRIFGGHVDDPIALHDRLADITTYPAYVQLLRKVPVPNTTDDYFAIIDELELDPPTPPANPHAFRRDTVSDGGWRCVVPEHVLVQGGIQFTAGHNVDAAGMDIVTNVAPVHATVANEGLEGSYPNVGSMLLLMRYACPVYAEGASDSHRIDAFTKKLRAGKNNVDNGHMPVFDLTQVAQQLIDPERAIAGSAGLYGVDRLNVPWGQLIYDYFTALPFENRFDPTSYLVTSPLPPGNQPEQSGGAGSFGDQDGDGVPGDRGFVGFLRANQPTVEASGMIVKGRINLNAASWKVLEGLPVFSPWMLPLYRDMPHLFDIADTSPHVMAPGEVVWARMLIPGGSPGLGENLVYPNGFPDTRRALTPVTTGPVADLAAPYPFVEQLGRDRARAMTAYREMRAIEDHPSSLVTAANYSFDPLQGYDLSGGFKDPRSFRARANGNADATPGWEKVNQRNLAGFLTVGELANVRGNGSGVPASYSALFDMDNGQNREFSNTPNYLFAIAPLVALNDSWLTVKGHSYTLYGTVRTGGDVTESNETAIRFEVGMDRSNLLLDPRNTNLRPTITYSVREPYLPTSPN